MTNNTIQYNIEVRKDIKKIKTKDSFTLEMYMSFELFPRFELQ